MESLHRIIQLRTSPPYLGIARIIIGLNAAFASLEAWRMLSRVLQPLVVKIPFFPWIPLLPSGALRIFLGVWLLAAVLFAIGWKTRVAGAVLSLVIGYTLIMDQQNYSNHLYLLFLVVLLLTIAESTRREWPILLLKIQITIVYVFSALAKITPQYLAGEILTRSLKQGWLAVPEVTSVLAVISIAAELFIACGLWSRRLRCFAIVAGIGFHVLIIATLDSSRLSLVIFALDVFAVYLLFVDAKKKAPAESQEHLQTTG